MSELGELPVELTEKIFNSLSIVDVEKFCSGRFKSKLIQSICLNQYSWKHFVLRDFSEFFNLQEPGDDDWRKYYYFLLDQCLVANSFLTEWDKLTNKGGGPWVLEIYRNILINKMLLKDAPLALSYIIDTYYDGKYEFDDDGYAIAVVVSLDTLQFVVEKSEWRSDTSWKDNLCELAVSNRKPNALKYLHEQGFPWDGATLLQSINSGCMKCFRYAHDNGCKLPEDEPVTVDMRGLKHYTITFREDFHNSRSKIIGRNVSVEFGDLIVERLTGDGVHVRITV